MGVVPYRFNDAFMAAGRRVSAVLPDGRDFWTNAVTPSGFILDGYDAAPFMPNLVQDNRTFDAIIAAKAPTHYWRTPTADLERLPDVAGINTDDMDLSVSPAEGYLGPPVVRGGPASWHMPFTLAGSLGQSRYTPVRYSSNWSSLARPDFYEMTFEVWWRPSQAFNHASVHMGRARDLTTAAPQWNMLHVAGRPRFRMYKADGVAFMDALAPSSAWNTDTLKLTVPVHQWVGSYDGLTTRFYQNGALLASVVNDYAPDQAMFDPSNSTFYFPLSTGTVNNNFPQDADIGPMIMYPRPLSDAEVAENWLIGANR